MRDDVFQMTSVTLSPSISSRSFSIGNTWPDGEEKGAVGGQSYSPRFAAGWLDVVVRGGVDCWK